MNPSMIRFRFAGLHGNPAECGIERIALQDGRVVIVATELPDNPGTSVTNAVEILVLAVCQTFRIEAQNLVWVEHYPVEKCPRCTAEGRCDFQSHACSICRGTGTRREATYDLVTFKFQRLFHVWRFLEPQWRPMQPDDWMEMGLAPRS